MFATPWLMVLDGARLSVFVVGFLLVGYYALTRWPQTASRYEKARVVGVAAALFVLAGSRATNLGVPTATWQFYASIVVFCLIGYSLAGERRDA